MKPAPFGYVRAGSLDEALAALAEGGEDAKPIAGGQSLVPALNLRLVRPTLLVDLNHAGLDGIAANGTLTVGATTRQAALVGDERVHPLVREALPFVGHFVTHFTTALGAGELVVETVWPLTATGESSAFEELALRAGDFAQAMVAVVLRRDAGGAVVEACVAVGAVSDRPIRLREVEKLLVGTSGAEAAADAGSLAASLVDPPGSIHASARYLRALTGALTTRAIERAA
jgi:carbon-monoxide dehydrogenase medium subunit